jgi:beta-galactosidase
VLAVRTDTSAQPASRWYSGAGIYGHVRFLVTDPVRFERRATFITTPVIRSNSATVHIAARVVNGASTAQSIKVAASVHGPPGSAPDGSYAAAGESAPATIPAGQAAEVGFAVNLPWIPRLWSIAQPDLHDARLRLRIGTNTLDEQVVAFGIRQIEFNSDTGFHLNGKGIKLKGACVHHDGGAFGAAVPLRVWERRLQNLRALGVNAIRTAHNPVGPDFLDLCDRMGFLVMVEAFDSWTVRKNPYDYSLYFKEWSRTDLRDMVCYGRNHPSVILWSVGNEIRDTPRAELAKGILKGLVEVCHESDPTRPVTQALFRPNTSGDYTNGLADLLDVIGTNYRDQELLAAWRDKPGRKIVGSEQGHDRRTWLACRDNPQHSGQFLWAGVDYLGESRSWPRIGYAGGLLDRTGEIKPMAYERQSWWSEKPMVKMVRRVAANDVLPEDPGWGGEERFSQVQFADWSPRNTEPHEANVEVYSNCDDVELFLNDKSLGSKPINTDASPRNWKVPFEPGRIKAVARNQGQIVANDELRTAGKAAKIALTVKTINPGNTLSPAWDDVAFVTARVVDENGVTVPIAKDLISFALEGPGVVAAVDNGDNRSTEPFQASERRAFQGRCVAFVKATAATGRISVTATASGLDTGRISLEVSAKSAR